MASRKLSSYDSLSVPERILVLQDLWDEIAADPEQVPITEAQRQELDRRLRAHRHDPEATSGWAQVKARVRARR
jgi:putative addiction module component (TIGR02574 family)